MVVLICGGLIMQKRSRSSILWDYLKVKTLGYISNTADIVQIDMEG